MLAPQDSWKRIGLIVSVWLFCWLILGQLTYPIVELFTGVDIMEEFTTLSSVIAKNKEAYLALGNDSGKMIEFVKEMGEEVQIDRLRPALMLYQAFQALCGFFLSVMILKFLLKIKPVSYLKLDQKPGWYFVLFLPFLFNFLFPIISLVGQTNQEMMSPEIFGSFYHWMEDLEYQNGVLSIMMGLSANGTDLVWALVVMAIIPAIGEEMVFRGLLQRELMSNGTNPHMAILFTGLFFSAVHFQFFSFIPRAGLGILLGYLYYWSNSLWVPILAHFINNASLVILMYFSTKTDSDVNLESVEYDGYLFSIILSFVATIFVLRGMFIRRTEFTLEPDNQ